jgi:hypothetical protein
MFNVTQAIGMPVTWIRFNPDGYKTISGHIGKAPITERHRVLLKWVKAALEKSPAETGNFAQVVYLYYSQREVISGQLQT